MKIDNLASKVDSTTFFYGKVNQDCVVYTKNDFNSDTLCRLRSNTGVAIVLERKKWYKIILTIESKQVTGFVWKNKITVK